MPASRVVVWLNALALGLISVALIAAFADQLLLGELPCPNGRGSSRIGAVVASCAWRPWRSRTHRGRNRATRLAALAACAPPSADPAGCLTPTAIPR